MFSSKIYQHFHNFAIQATHQTFFWEINKSFWLGNFFAIKTIQFAAKVKRSVVFLEIMNGVQNLI